VVSVHGREEGSGALERLVPEEGGLQRDYGAD